MTAEVNTVLVIQDAKHPQSPKAGRGRERSHPACNRLGWEEEATAWYAMADRKSDALGEGVGRPAAASPSGRRGRAACAEGRVPSIPVPAWQS